MILAELRKTPLQTRDENFTSFTAFNSDAGGSAMVLTWFNYTAKTTSDHPTAPAIVY